jgi:hypothetical protein
MFPLLPFDVAGAAPLVVALFTTFGLMMKFLLLRG